MKQMRKQIRVVLAALLCLFVLLIGYGAYSFTTYDTRWFTSGSNSFARTAKKNVTPGDIYDRSGVLLATSSDGERVYQSDTAARMAVVHVLGDNLSHVSYGVETFMASYLYGFNASYLERLSTALRGEKRRGDDVTLTIDSKLSTLVAAEFAKGGSVAGKCGAVVVMNYKTGEVLSIQSFPTFDPANIPTNINSDPQTPYFNRAIQGLYAPGSTFKVLTMASALQNLSAAQTMTYTCDGKLQVGDNIITDAGTTKEDVANGTITGHGSLTLRQAFTKSCNNTFAALALQLGDKALQKTAQGFGFDDNFLFRDFVVLDSIYPTTNRTEKELAWTGVGQSALQVTPLHMCMIAAAVANDGVMMEPRVLLSAASSGGTVRTTYTEKVYRKAISSDVSAVLTDYMRAVVQSGTGTGANISGLRVCGKTGSAQLDTQENTNAWFIGFIDDDAYPYAVSIVIEDAGGGGSVAAPVAKKIFQYLSGK